MARIIPFAALRPTPEYASKVAALPYDVMSTEEAREMAKDNPHSFLHIDKAEISFPPGMAFNDPAVYKKVDENLQKLITNNVLINDTKPCLYIYRLIMNGRSQTGLASCVYVEDYENDKIKKHEFTRPDKERDRVEHIKACKAHTGPIFLAYRAKKEISDIINNWVVNNSAAYDFVATDGVSHQLWVVNDDATIKALTLAFETVPCLYIADGHHRSAAASIAHKEGGSGQFLAVTFPQDELEIMDYNRVVKDLNGMDKESFLSKLKNEFTITESTTPVAPKNINEFGMYLKGQWYKLQYTPPMPNDAVDGLAISVLQNQVLSPLLGIKDPRTDNRIDFVGGIRGMEGLTSRVDNDEMTVAFSITPTTMDELFNVADAGRIMPPKSTWFEPKLLSGLLIHRF